MRHIELPGAGSLEIEHVVLDLNGTLTDRGVLIAGVAERIARLAEDLEIHLLTADTFGTANDVARELGVAHRAIRKGAEKGAFVAALGAEGVAAVGNGRNDEAMLRAARLGIAVIGPEGGAAAAVTAADVVCTSVTAALDLLLDDRALAATLRP